MHLGKHGSMEWLPGKNAALSASCATDAAIGNLPLVYPFLVNDPGEGTQARRRARAVIIDPLTPPLTRAARRPPPRHPPGCGAPPPLRSPTFPPEAGRAWNTWRAPSCPG